MKMSGGISFPQFEMVDGHPEAFVVAFTITVNMETEEITIQDNNGTKYVPSGT